MLSKKHEYQWVQNRTNNNIRQQDVQRWWR